VNATKTTLMQVIALEARERVSNQRIPRKEEENFSNQVNLQSGHWLVTALNSGRQLAECPTSRL